MDKRLARWLNSRRLGEDLEVSSLDNDRWTEWAVRDGAIKRLRGGFFEVRAFEYCANGDAKKHLLLIDQPEVGILGFATRQQPDGKREILIQGKTEPGNVRRTQIGPTVQATRSNYMQLHGGRETPYLKTFLDVSLEDVSVDVQQSEQGTVFLGKFNRNVLLRDQHLDEDGLQYIWASLTEVLSGLLIDFAVNTDARSVLVCSDWRDLSKVSEPFSRPAFPGPFGNELRTSFLHKAASGWLERLERDLGTAPSDSSARLKNRAIEGLEGWSPDRSGFVNPHTGTFVRMFSVTAPGREVDSWQQPLMGMSRQGRMALMCRTSSGVLRFLFRPSREPGFEGRTELGPLMDFGGTVSDEVLRWGMNAGERVLSVKQSEEGGRFYRVINQYEIRRIAENDEVPGNAGIWLTLAQIQVLAQRRGFLTNEARSAISLLLPFV